MQKPILPNDLLGALRAALSTPASAEARRAGPRPEEASNLEADVRCLKILLAEDHPVNQKVAVHMLEKMGHSVVVAGDGRKALAALQNNVFDLVLMDVQMPEMDGFETVRAIRSREEGAGTHMPVIALTAHAMKGDRERCLEAGFDDYLSKPIRAEELRRTLGENRSRTGERAEVVGGPVWEQLLQTCGGDAEFARELADSFLETAPRLIAGVDAALTAGDASRLAAEAHGLKGISQTIGAEVLAVASRAVEEAGRGADLAGAAALAPALRTAWGDVKAVLLSRTRRRG